MPSQVRSTCHADSFAAPSNERSAVAQTTAFGLLPLSSASRPFVRSRLKGNSESILWKKLLAAMRSEALALSARYCRICWPLSAWRSHAGDAAWTASLAPNLTSHFTAFQRDAPAEQCDRNIAVREGQIDKRNLSCS